MAARSARRQNSDSNAHSISRGTCWSRVLSEAELATLLGHLRGHWLYMPTLIAASTGLRRGEVLGLRWHDIDFTKGTLQVTQSVEVIGGEICLTEPKTDRSRRTLKLPASLLPELTRHRKEQAELRLRLGLGKADLVFTSPEGAVLNPTVFSETFARQVRSAGVRATKFHGLRHLHISHLLKSGEPVHVVSARAGHARRASRLTPARTCSAAKTTKPPNRPTICCEGRSVPIRCQLADKLLQFPINIAPFTKL